MLDSLDPFLLVDTFIQVNTIKGYRYLDTAGQIANEQSDRFSSIEVGIDGMRMQNPTDGSDHLKEIKVSSSTIWLHYGRKTPSTQLRQESTQVIERIASILGVDGYTRQGMRCYLLWPIDDEELGPARLAASLINKQSLNLQKLGELSRASLETEIKINPHRVRVNIHPATLQTVQTKIVRGGNETPISDADPDEDDSEYPPFGYLLDVDILDDRRTKSIPIKPHVNHALQIIREQILPVARPFFEGIV